eukprot:Colp12_sorted_trinity150504_noHs@2772
MIRILSLERQLSATGLHRDDSAYISYLIVAHNKLKTKGLLLLCFLLGFLLVNALYSSAKDAVVVRTTLSSPNLNQVVQVEFYAPYDEATDSKAVVHFLDELVTWSKKALGEEVVVSNVDPALEQQVKIVIQNQPAVENNERLITLLSSSVGWEKMEELPLLDYETFKPVRKIGKVDVSYASGEITVRRGLNLQGGIIMKRVPVLPNTMYHLNIVGASTVRKGPSTVFVDLSDPNSGQHLPRSYDFHNIFPSKRTTTQKILIRTLCNMTEMDIAFVVSKSRAGYTFQIMKVELEYLDSAAKFVALSQQQKQGKTVVATVATVAGRETMVVEAVMSILPFVNKVRVFSNSAVIPHELSALSSHRVTIATSAVHDDIGDVGKFFWVDKDRGKYDYHLVFDDDILYPTDYVSRMAKKMEEYKDAAALGVHCIMLKQPFNHYYDFSSRHVTMFFH